MLFLLGLGYSRIQLVRTLNLHKAQNRLHPADFMPLYCFIPLCAVIREIETLIDYSYSFFYCYQCLLECSCVVASPAALLFQYHVPLKETRAAGVLHCKRGRLCC